MGIEADNKVFEALADPTRRRLLDRLFAQGGLSLTELAASEAMTRFGVMKHLRVLEEANLVTHQKVGRYKRHYLNPVPIQQVYERYVHKFSQQHAAALTALKAALEDERGPAMMTSAPIQHAFAVYIQAPPEAIWEAITTPAGTQQFFYGAAVEVTPTRYVSKGPDGAVWADDPVFTFDPPHTLTHQWRTLWDPEMAQEPPSRVRWELAADPNTPGLTKVTLIHDQLEHAPKTAQGLGDGWAFILSGLKTWLETGAPLGASPA